ncbi:UDP-N-acetylmuramoyl-L-alanyl-D-glutamate--2,6-diaminopimelate ligase [Candidatus Curtissbacteria bacterium]|nr:UDP-N-acetylmuramoyl-L-alanyl-D-glutamate--2,6-diaminopimelate ligase [Candidatus Curtissbacteria bacterium]
MWQKIKNYYHLLQAAKAALFFNYPSKHISVIGVTGTDGKTTTAHMIYEILRSQTPKVSMISSIYAVVGSKSYDTGFHVTTPSSWQIQKFLRRAVDSGHKYFILETTSHGLDQNRLAFVNVDVGILTNITHEHLDYHGSWEKYALAKSKLFKKTNFAILNYDDAKSYEFLKNKVTGKLITYSLKQDATYSLKNFPLKLKVLGAHNLSNALAAAAATSTLGISKQKITKALNSFRSPKGRLDKIDLKQNFDVYIDFAHTPNGLSQALSTLRATTRSNKSRLIVVFGAASERDVKKRPIMGGVADEFADIVILTSEDPRREKPAKIAAEIAKGIKHKSLNKTLFVTVDRAQAIEQAIMLAQPSDIVGTFGKGHEKSMTIGRRDYKWDEYEIVKQAIRKKMHAK